MAPQLMECHKTLGWEKKSEKIFLKVSNSWTHTHTHTQTNSKENKLMKNFSMENFSIEGK